MKFLPADIILDINERHDPYSVIKRWVLGNPFEHVRMFYGSGIASTEIPLFYESVGRGVILTQAHDFIGKKVAVMRLDVGYQEAIPDIIGNAFHIATQIQSKYDYMCVPGIIIPRLICEKLGIPLPLKYQRNPLMVCSEAVAEPFWRAGVPILPQDIVPLPGDFFTSPILHLVEYAPISKDWL